MKIGNQLYVWVLVSFHVSSAESVFDGSRLAARLSMRSALDDLSPDDYNTDDTPEMSRSVRDAMTSGRTRGTRPTPASDLRFYEGATKHIRLLSSKPSAYESVFTDEGWKFQWYAQDYRGEAAGPVMDHNLVPAYRLGYTGHGVTVAVVDGGVESTHKDLKPNIVEELNYDLIYKKKRSGFGSMTLSYEEITHATRVAGVIAMVANNTRCGTGVAFNAGIASLRILHPSKVTDLAEAQSMIMHLDKIHIYSCSWGGKDDGSYMRSLPVLSAYSFAKGANEGRSGKGAIYVFGGGSGKERGDGCGADTYVNIQYTIAIASATANGQVTWYGERCAAIMATAYGSGYTGDEFAYTTDTNQRCTNKFSGNSPSTAIASGIIALALQANPELTYRDVMHLITMSAEVAPLADNADTWRRNHAGFWVSHDFGFGLMNAENMVILAKGWTPVVPLTSCDVLLNSPEKPWSITNKSTTVILKVKTDACHRTGNGVYYLESFQLNATISYPYRGALFISIASPQGTTSTMLEPRIHDRSREGLKEWTMKSNQAWGEDPYGVWTVTIRIDRSEKGGFRSFLDYLYNGFSWETKGAVHALNLRLHGTADFPYGAESRLDMPRRYSAFRLPDNQTSDPHYTSAVNKHHSARRNNTLEMLDWVLLAAVAIATGLYWYTTRQHSHWSARGVAALPGALPGVGHMGAAVTLKKSAGWIACDIYRKAADQPAIGIYSFGRPALVVRDLSLVQAVLVSDFSSFHDNVMQIDEQTDPITGKNPFILKGERWKTVRQRLAPALSPSRIKSMFPMIQRVCQDFNNYMQNHLNEDIDVHHITGLFTSDVVAKVAFALDGKAFTDAHAEFYENGKKLWDTSVYNPLAVLAVQYFPFIFKFLGKQFFPWDVTQFFSGLIHQVAELRATHPEKAPDNDYLQYLLSLKEKHEDFTIDDVVAQSLTFFTDGFETSSVTSSFLLYELAMHPDIQEDLRAQVQAMDSFNFENITSLPLLDRIFQETLRKYSIISMSRACTKDTTLHADGRSFPISKKIEVMIPVYGIHHDPQYYPNPEKFDPDRFLPLNSKSRHPMAFLGFGGGPRTCIGYRFATAQVKVLVANVVSHFQVARCAKTADPMVLLPVYMMPVPDEGIWLRFTKISS